MMKNMYRNDEALTIRLKMPGTGKIGRAHV